MAKILLSAALPEAGMRLLRGPDLELDILERPDEALLAERIADADAVVMVWETPSLREAAIARAPLLRVACRFGAGYDNFDVAALTARRIPLATTGEANAVAVAEHTLYLILALAKRGIVHDRAVRSGDWAIRAAATAQELAGKTALVVGGGRIGGRVAQLCAAFDMRVVVADPDPAAASGFAHVADFRSALGEADIVSLNLPLSPATAGIFGAAEFAAMKPTAFLVNTARGGVIDEAALLRALAERRIGGAGLDVRAVEPPRPDDPLLGLDNVVLTPHTGAAAKETLDRTAEICARNVLDGLAGRLDPRLVVNREVLPAPR